MIPAHHIQRQQIILETGDSIPTSQAQQWYKRLERLHYSAVVPALEHRLDAMCPNGETIVLERVELEVHIDQIDQVETQLELALQRELAGLEAPRRKVERAPSATVLEALVYFLQSGNIHWSAGEPTSWIKQLESEYPHWKMPQWEQLFSTLAANVSVSFFRLSQVSISCLNYAVEQLESVGGKESLNNTHSKFSYNVKLNIEQLKERLTAAGYLIDSSNGDEQADPATESANVSEISETWQTAKRESSYYIPNAGLVILSPYFKYLTEQTHCFLADGKLDSNRMAGLLEAVISTEVQIKEWEQPLTKVLLGMQPEEPLQPVTPSTAELKIIEELLSGIIGHWSVLKNTSNAGLREGFLQRSGRLSREGNAWRLQVEKQAHDILLAHLPWGIGLVKTPWMDEFLQVDWA